MSFSREQKRRLFHCSLVDSLQRGICLAGSKSRSTTKRRRTWFICICAFFDWAEICPPTFSFHSTILFLSSLFAGILPLIDAYLSLSLCRSAQSSSNDGQISASARWSLTDFEQFFRSFEIVDYGLFVPSTSTDAHELTNDTDMS